MRNKTNQKNSSRVREEEKPNTVPVLEGFLSKIFESCDEENLLSFA